MLETLSKTEGQPVPSDTDTVGHADMANAIRALAMDAVETAGSGHPGMPMGMADVATVLFRDFLKFDPDEPDWPDRDRFVLSAGHGSMLLYALLHLTGYPGMTVEELKRFRQLGSLTPGHPEYRHTPGVETTTGPLGQGLANAVGMALAERLANARHGDRIVDHDTYVIVGDGCLMEGISHEAVSLAGHLGLARLIVLFDDNGISIDGPLELACSDDQLVRFRASGWDAEAIDGHDPAQIATAIAAARSGDRPSLIACRTTIGFGAPNKQGTAATHGAPLGAAEVAAARKALGWPHPAFEIPAPVLGAWRRTGERGRASRRAWLDRLDRLDARARDAWDGGRSDLAPDALRSGLRTLMGDLVHDRPALATRKASEMALEALTVAVPRMVGGSADLTGSNNTRTAATAPVAPGDFAGRYLHYGVREHAMAAAMNGMALHGGVIPYGGTFLAFADYCRPAIRLAAMMGLQVIHVFTHDSIGLGEDGPTHQPVEHLASLRAIPNLNVFRPADAVETAECWAAALASPTTPSVIALSRQSLPALRVAPSDENLCARGAYVLAEAHGHRNATLLATGSEVSVALAARDLLAEEGIKAAVVSMPCWALFDGQPGSYRDYVLGRAPRIAVEAGSRFGWTRYVDREVDVVGIAGFGASAPAGALFEHFGITAGAVADRVRLALDRWRVG